MADNNYVNQVTITTTGADQVLIGSNSRRRALLLSAPLTGRVTISFIGPAVIDNGITMYAGTQPVMLAEDNFGTAVRQEIRCIGSAGAILFSVLELSNG